MLTMAKSDTNTSGGYHSGFVDLLGSMNQSYSVNAVAGVLIKYQVQIKDVARWTGNFCDVVEETATWQNAGFSDRDRYSYSTRCDVQYRARSFDRQCYSSWKYMTVLGGGTGGGGSTSCPTRPCDIAS
ncbi:hypothetical protein [Microbulbifer variabilis]|uniref:hypothetical protein n=1 Tax=Microbulbifer variabilis TaxID=266805 RepID=UPI001CFF4D18|nr:hypothetical protein [Microbulbifer variabilis]